MLSIDQIKQMSEANRESAVTGNGVQINIAKAANKAAVAQTVWQSEEIRSQRQSFEKEFGFDFADSKEFPVHEANFSWKAVARKCGHATVREAVSGSTFPQVLRAGVQTLVNSMYMTVPTTFESWTKTVSSNKDTELYAPLHGISFLREVGKQELYPESRAAGLDIKLVNRKYGEIFAVEKELLEDDQTGQFSQQAALLGEYAKIAIEAFVYAKVAGKFTGGALANYAGLIIPNTETQPSTEATYPFVPASAPFVGGGFNRPASYGILTSTTIQAGFIGLMNQLNLLGLKMSVDPDTILIGPQYRFDLAILLNSSFYPSVPSGTAGATGANFAINPIESIAKAVITRFMWKNDATVTGDSKAWYLLDSKKPFFVVQLREAATVEQEAPTSGESFNRDVVRFKLRERFNADYIDPRFIWQGDDGSVTS